VVRESRSWGWFQSRAGRERAARGRRVAEKGACAGDGGRARAVCRVQAAQRSAECRSRREMGAAKVAVSRAAQVWICDV
jgi:hypothetical protein